MSNDEPPFAASVAGAADALPAKAGILRKGSHGVIKGPHTKSQHFQFPVTQAYEVFALARTPSLFLS